MKFTDAQQACLAAATVAAQDLADATGFPVYVVIDRGQLGTAEHAEREPELSGCDCLLCLLDL